MDVVKGANREKFYKSQNFNSLFNKFFKSSLLSSTFLRGCSSFILLRLRGNQGAINFSGVTQNAFSIKSSKQNLRNLQLFVYFFTELILDGTEPI